MLHLNSHLGDAVVAKKKLLPLTEYSNKYGVSISTLRRRIKAGKVECEYLNGKYFLKDIALENHEYSKEQVIAAPPQKEDDHESHNEPTAKASGDLSLNQKKSGESQEVFETANRLLNEIKKAYSLILSEKEEQIIHLREEVADLKTLVRVLESDNERLKANLGESSTIDPWLK